MQKTSKPVLKTPARKASATKSGAVKPKAKPAAKSKPRPVPVQLELFPLVERLTQAAERLAAAAERLAEATVPPRTVSQQLHDRPGQPAETISDLATPGEAVADLTIPALDMPVDDATDEE